MSWLIAGELLFSLINGLNITSDCTLMTSSKLGGPVMPGSQTACVAYE